MERETPAARKDTAARRKTQRKALAKGGGKRIHAYQVNPRRSKAMKSALKREGRPRLRGPEARASARKATSARNR